MADLPMTIRAALAGATIIKSHLVFLDYLSGPVRVWSGFGMLETGGQTWGGVGDLGSISALEMPVDGNAPVTTLTLSGVKPEWVPRARAAATEVRGRTCQIFVQHFDLDHQLLDGPLCLYTGLMDTIKIVAPDARTRRVELTVEWLFARRGIAPFGYLTDEDQQARYPGDRGAEFVSAMQNHSVKWPVS